MTTTTTHADPALRTDGPLGGAPSGLDLGLLVLRVGVGLTMAAHGAQKLFGSFGGGGLDGTGEFFTFLGYPAGDTMALIAGLAEFLGGLGLVLGLLTPLASAAVVGTLINALFSAHADDAWLGGYELPLVLAAAAAALALTGPGRYAVDRLLPVSVLREPRLVQGLAALALAVVSAIVVLLIRS